MNIDSLEKLVAEQVEEIQLPGDQTVNLQPMTAEDNISLSLWLVENGLTDETKAETPEETARFNCFVVSKCVVELQKVDGKAKWVKTLDSDHGRELLAKIQGRKLHQLASAAKRKSGLDIEAAKKNSPPMKNLLGGSAFSGESSADLSSSGGLSPQSNGSSGSSSIANVPGAKIAQTSDSTHS